MWVRNYSRSRTSNGYVMYVTLRFRNIRPLNADFDIFVFPRNQMTKISTCIAFTTYSSLNATGVKQWHRADFVNLGRLDFDSRKGQVFVFFFFFSTASKPALGTAQPHFQWVPGGGGFFPGHEPDHSPPSNAKSKNAWSYTSTPSYVFVACNYREKFTLQRVLHIWLVLFLSRIWCILPYICYWNFYVYRYIANFLGSKYFKARAIFKGTYKHIDLMTISFLMAKLYINRYSPLVPSIV